MLSNVFIDVVDGLAGVCVAFDGLMMAFVGLLVGPVKEHTDCHLYSTLLFMSCTVSNRSSNLLWYWGKSGPFRG